MKALNRDRTHDLRVIWATARRIGIDSDTLHALNATVNGISSIAALNEMQRGSLIKELFRKGRKPRKESVIYCGPRQRSVQPPPDNLIQLVGADQQVLIRELLQKLGWGDPRRYKGFCKRVINKPIPRTVQEAQKIIEAFKAMIRRDYGRQAIPRSET